MITNKLIQIGFLKDERNSKRIEEQLNEGFIKKSMIYKKNKNKKNVRNPFALTFQVPFGKEIT